MYYLLVKSSISKNDMEKKNQSPWSPNTNLNIPRQAIASRGAALLVLVDEPTSSLQKAEHGYQRDTCLHSCAIDRLMQRLLGSFGGQILH